MLDIKFIEQNRDLVVRNNELRGSAIDIDAILTIERRRKVAQGELDGLRAEINQFSKQNTPEISGERREQGRVLKTRESVLVDHLATIKSQLDQCMSWLPNMLDPRVPIGGEDANVTLREVGCLPVFDFTPRSHEDLGERLNIIDLRRGTNTAKSRFFCLKNEGLLLRMAMTRMFIDMVKDFQLVSPPYVTKDRALFASGYLPFAQKDNFRIEGEDLSLIGTSEQALLGMHLDEMLTELPLCYIGDSMCFRTEAGSYGRDVKGIIRVHQFYKLEQLIFCHPDDSEAMHLRCLENEEKFMQMLEIPYRVILCASEDLGAPGRMKYDTEAWLPSQNRYREMTSNTNMGDYQTRRGNIRAKTANGEKFFPHTISATGFCDRLIVALLENHQNKDGSINIPRALQPYTSGMKMISSKA